ncbi:Rossmann-like domain-containing protein [Methanocaldococcus indicus]|uniref:Rossmann-like domain-containing protein n=1 Tax=Methanocaldococcus indicus TaxID=213231 RepID=UPI003C6CEFB2
MTIFSNIIKKTKKLIKNSDFQIVDFSFSYPYSYVLIEDDEGNKSLGVAMMLLEEIHPKMRFEIKKDIDDFLVESYDIVDRTLTLAFINAVSQYYIKLDEEDFKRTLLDVVDNNKKVALIGNMTPIVKYLKNNYNNLEIYIFERNPKNINENVYSDSYEYSLLPNMDVVFISGTSLLNNTIDMILDRAKNSINVLVGATAQLYPEFLKEYNVDYIASTKIYDIEKVLKFLKSGSSFGYYSAKLSKKYMVKL